MAKETEKVNESKFNMYFNHGDINLIPWGGMLVNSYEAYRGLYRILNIQQYPETDENGNEIYLFENCDININDDWIDKDAVESYADTSKEKEPLNYAMACVEYYGGDEFKDSFLSYNTITETELKDILRHYNIATDNLNITW